MEPVKCEDEVIQQQMAETRASLEEKLETLEQKVVGTVANASTAVNETVEVIKDSVQDTVCTVNETVKESVETVKDWFDVSAHVREHPWWAMGGSVATGFCLASLLSKSAAPQYMASPDYRPRPEPLTNGGLHDAPARQTEQHAMASSASSTWAPEIDKLKSLAIGALFSTARDLIVSSMSEKVGAQLKDVIDSVTRKAGGEPIPSMDWITRTKAPSHECQPTSASEEIQTREHEQQETDKAHAMLRRW